MIMTTMVVSTVIVVMTAIVVYMFVSTGNVVHFASGAYTGLVAAAAFARHRADVGRFIFFTVFVGRFFDFYGRRIAAIATDYRET